VEFFNFASLSNIIAEQRVGAHVIIIIARAEVEAEWDIDIASDESAEFTFPSAVPSTDEYGYHGLDSDSVVKENTATQKTGHCVLGCLHGKRHNRGLVLLTDLGHKTLHLPSSHFGCQTALYKTRTSHKGNLFAFYLTPNDREK